MAILIFTGTYDMIKDASNNRRTSKKEDNK